MNKSEIVDKLFKKNNFLTRSDIDHCVQEILNFTSDALAEGKRLEIRGFGSFSTRKRSIRMARNPKTGDAVKVNSKFHPYFRAAKSLRNNLKG